MELIYDPPGLQDNIPSLHIKECVKSTLENILLAVDMTEEDLYSEKQIKVKLLNLEDYIEENLFERKILTIEMDVKIDDISEKIYLFMDVHLAIMLAGMMMMIPDAAIHEKLENTEVSESDLEVLFEIGNILAGHYDDFIKAKTKKDDIKISIAQIINYTDFDSIEKENGLLIENFYHYEKLDSSYLNALFFFQNVSKKLWNLEDIEDIEESEESEESDNLETSEDKDSILIIQETTSEPEMNIKSYLYKDFDIHTVNNIGEVKDILGKERIILILLDVSIQIPGGITIDKWIRAMTMTSKIPVVAFSASPTKNTVINALKNGAVDFIALPWNKEKVISKIKEDIKIHSSKSIL